MFLCLDLGTKTGWAVDDGRTITSGIVEFRNSRFEGGGMRYLRFKAWLSEIQKTAGPFESIHFEEVRSHKGVDAAHVYGGLLGMLSAWCEHHKVPYQGYTVGAIKRHATGKGNATKIMMKQAAIDRGHAPTDDNEADAIAIAYLRRSGTA